MRTQLKIGTVTFPETTRLERFDIEIRSRAGRFEGEDGRIYSLDFPLTAELRLSVYCPFSDGFKTDLTAFYAANRYTAFDVVDPMGIPLGNCKFRRDDRLVFKPVLIATEEWEITFSLNFLDFAANDAEDLTAYDNLLIWQGGDEDYRQRVSEGVASDNSAQLWLLSPAHTVRQYSFEWADEKRNATGVWPVARYYASRFYQTVTVPALPFHPDGFSGVMDDNSISFNWRDDVWSSSKFSLISYGV
jgi:hypothetical protein